MSYRTRLALFFLLIVAIPIGAIAALVVGVAGSSAAGKADARISTGLETALAVHEEAVDDAARALDRIAEDPQVVSAIRAGRPAGVLGAARQAARRLSLAYLSVTTPTGETAVADEAEPVAMATLRTTGPAGDYVFDASVLGADEYLAGVKRLTGLDAALADDTGAIAATNGVEGPGLPAAGESGDAPAGEDVRAAAAALPGSSGERVVLFAETDAGGFLESRPAIVIVVGAILLAALAGVLALGRSLREQIAEMLAAARRIGSGDFSRRVPEVGRDEMAGLASEFNKMTDRVEAQMEQLRRQRGELDRAVGRLGEAIAAGLDRDALLAIVAENATTACEAEYARVSLDDGTLIEFPPNARGGARDTGAAAQKRAAAELVWVHSQRKTGNALAAPIARPGREADARGVLAIARVDTPFGDSEQETFQILVAQAAASVQNITVHEERTEQATKDDLTGLPNNRSFRETMELEAQRAERFGHELSLIILDVDDFKGVNDTYGHLQGDEVLRVVGRLLAEEPRAIDEPARYGGEEFVVALPETGVAGAVELAERIRERLAAQEIPKLDGGGTLKVTASFGTATMLGAADSVRELFAAADEALYEAKRTGKNRVATAPEAVRAQR